MIIQELDFEWLNDVSPLRWQSQGHLVTHREHTAVAMMECQTRGQPAGGGVGSREVFLVLLIQQVEGGSLACMQVFKFFCLVF